MNLRRSIARAISKTPLHGRLCSLARIFERYVDASNNYNDCEFATNGEGFVVARCAPHWRLVLDVGANLADWTLSVLAKSAAATVHCFEPSPVTYRHLTDRIGRMSNVVLHNTGIGAMEGVLLFHDYGVDSGISSFFSREGSVGKRPERVLELPITTLDAFISGHSIDHVDFVKIDTEGAEMSVLEGMAGTLSKGLIDGLQFEYGGTWIDAGRTLGSACKFLKAKGYEVFRMQPEHLSPLQYSGSRDERYKYSNYIAAKSRAVLERWGMSVKPASG